MKGLNEFIVTALLLAISFSGLIISLTVVKPLIEKSQDNFVINEALVNMQRISNVIREISSEGEGSRRNIEIKITDGMYIFDEDTDTLNFTYKLKSDLSFSGYKDGINISTSNRNVNMFIKIENVDFLNGYRLRKGDNSISFKHEGFDDGVIKISVGS
jgi:hypothetical protein